MALPVAPPPALHCRHFAASPMCRPLPAHPAVSPFSTIWIAEQAQPGTEPRFPDLARGLAAAPGTRDEQTLALYADAGPAGSVIHVIRCSGVAWSAATCAKRGTEGERVRVPRGAFPAGGPDHHFSLEDDVAGREIDFWGARAPSDVPDSPLLTLTAGQCAYDGDGSGCSGATATNIATSLGAIEPHALAAAEIDPHGSLPYAIATALLCASPTWVYPADFSDGANTDATPACRDHLGPNGRPPEGVRYFLDLSDDAIDAMPDPPYVKAILRTLDREHYGGTVTDTNWSGAPGPALQAMRGDWSAVERERDARAPSAIDLVRYLKFCTNGTC